MYFLEQLVCYGFYVNVQYDYLELTVKNKFTNNVCIYIIVVFSLDQ